MQLPLWYVAVILAWSSFLVLFQRRLISNTSTTANALSILTVIFAAFTALSTFLLTDQGRGLFLQIQGILGLTFDIPFVLMLVEIFVIVSIVTYMTLIISGYLIPRHVIRNMTLSLSHYDGGGKDVISPGDRVVLKMAIDAKYGLISAFIEVVITDPYFRKTRYFDYPRRSSVEEHDSGDLYGLLSPERPLKTCFLIPKDADIGDYSVVVRVYDVRPNPFCAFLHKKFVLKSKELHFDIRQHQNRYA